MVQRGVWDVDARLAAVSNSGNPLERLSTVMNSRAAPAGGGRGAGAAASRAAL